EDEARLVEGAEQVLAVRRIDAGLAADRAVDLRQQRGRELDEIHAAPGNGGGEAGEVADHPAPEGKDDVAALEPGGEDRLDHLAQPDPGLAGLTGRDLDHGEIEP